MSMRNAFAHFAKHVAKAIGSPYAFALALALIIAWALMGPMFGFSSSWQLIINTGTTIITFLVVFLIQTTQNRDAKAVHLKLDELIHSVSQARNRLIDAEDLTEEELDRLDSEFRKLREKLDSRQRTSRHKHGDVAHVK
jgi:low affinity Fe/Cu permease